MNSNGTLFLNRFEVKYLVDRTTCTALTQDLAAFMRPDAHAGADGCYLVRSLYFDTPGYTAYHEKLNGIAERHKLRIRVYGDNPSQASFVRLEVKSRYLNYVKKLTTNVPLECYPEIEFALQRRTLPPAWLFEDSSAREFFRIQRQYNMQPVVLVQYRRQAYERMEMNRTRVNLDHELMASRNLDLLAPMTNARRVLGYGHAVFEIKVDNVLPALLHTLISKYNLWNETVSKYCFAVRSEARFSPVSRWDGS